MGGQELSLATEEETSDILSRRLVGLLDDVLEGRAPNAGRFCGYCYHPLPSAARSASKCHCPHCHRSSTEWPAVTRVPVAVFAMYRSQRWREGWTVRSIAWSGLTVGIVLGLLPLAFFGVSWWTLLAFFAPILLFYIGSANMANTLGDAAGYRWGQAVLRRRWEAFVREREDG